MDKRNYKAEVITFIIALSLIIAVLVFIGCHKQSAIRQEYLEKGIYEVEDTFGLGANDILSTVFMICEPPSDKEELERVVFNFIEENDILQTIKKRKIDQNGIPTQQYYLNINLIKLYFVEPSKSYPIGWNRGEHAGFFSGFITDHTIIEVRIPWESTDTSDFEIFHHSK
jgi:hypothetical protein